MRLNRNIVQVLRAMILEFNDDQRHWVSLIPVVQSSLNQTSVPLLANRSSVELFIGLAPPSSLGYAFLPEPAPGMLTELNNTESIERGLVELRTSLSEMHRTVADV